MNQDTSPPLTEERAPQIGVGQLLGSCLLEEILGCGGMATVYRASQTLMKRTVAVKLLKPKLGEEQRNLRNFLKEAMTIARLQHPSIAQVFYAGEDRGQYYLVMEYIDGRDLRKVLRQDGPLSLWKTLEVGRQVADILAYTHDRRMIHRDIKPANIMVRASGEAVLTDFGIASLLCDPDSGSWGTLHYMSPEQFQGDRIDERSDLYSLGVTLYVLLTGTVPFRTNDRAELRRRVLEEPPPDLSEALPATPKKVSRIIDRLLAKDPNDRFASARDVVHAIDGVTTGTGQIELLSLPLAKKRNRLRLSRVAVALGFAMALGGVIFGALWTVFLPSEVLERVTFRNVIGAESISEAIDVFAEAIRRGDLDSLLPIVAPSARTEPEFLESLAALFRTASAVDARIILSQVLLSEDETRAQVFLVFGSGTRQPVLQVNAAWTKAGTDRWFLRPDSSRGEILYGTVR